MHLTKWVERAMIWTCVLGGAATGAACDDSNGNGPTGADPGSGDAAPTEASTDSSTEGDQAEASAGGGGLGQNASPSSSPGAGASETGSPGDGGGTNLPSDGGASSDDAGSSSNTPQGEDAGSSGGDGGTHETDGNGGGLAPPSCDAPSWDPATFSTVYDVGPGHAYETPSDVPWESLGAGTLVRIHRRATPYADKWVIAAVGTADEPIVVLGVPEAGLLPEITGRSAVTRSALNYWSDGRGVIKIGGSSVPAVERAEHVFVECLDISGARASNSFQDEAGSVQTYSANASAIFLENGAHITLRNNVFHDSGNGLFIANQSSDVRVSGNQLFDNGNPDSIYEHNSYTEARGIVFEFNRYGDLCAGCPGNNLKDRSSGLVIRYNFIEGGNRALDLVDSSERSISGAADYDDTFVYGNVLIEKDGGNRQIVHYGGDGDEARFRRGTLYFFHNTVVSQRSSLATVVRLSSANATLDARNNVFFASRGSDLAILEDAGTAQLRGNWLPSGWREGSPSLTGSVTANDNVEGDAPGFVEALAGDFTLVASSSARGICAPLADAALAHPVNFEFVPPSGGRARAATSAAGAFE